jgi:hypothetical protein
MSGLLACIVSNAYGFACGAGADRSVPARDYQSVPKAGSADHACLGSVVVSL